MFLAQDQAFDKEETADSALCGKSVNQAEFAMGHNY